MAEYRDVEQQIRNLITNEQFDEANQAAVRAKQVVEAGKQYADPASKYESLRGEVEALAEFVQTEERSYHTRKVEETRRQIEEQRAARLREDTENRQRQVEALMSQAAQHRKDGDLDAAIMVLKHVTVIDPKYEPARWMMDDLDELRSFREGRQARDEFYRETRGALNEVEKAKIPWHVELKYPSNWPEIIASEHRGGPGAGARGKLFAALDKPISVDFVDDPLKEVVARLIESRNLNLYVDWKDLKLAGIEPSTPIMLQLPREISLKRALTEITKQAGAGTADVGFEIIEDMIKIATRETLDKETFAVVYDVTDLLMEIPYFNDSPMRDLVDANERAAQRIERPAVHEALGRATRRRR